MRNLLLTFSTLLLLTNAQAQLVNPGFENWEGPGTGTYPTGWQWIPGTMEWNKTTDARSGAFALEVNVWYYYTDTKAEQWAPISYRPAAFTGWYKYTGNTITNQTTNQTTDDTAFATVYLTKWNTVTSKSDTIGRGSIFLLGSPDYRRFTCPITYTGAAVPDTVVVSMDPSLMRNGGTYFSPNTDGRNSFLKIDDLSLPETVTYVYDAVRGAVKAWPNPAGDHLNVEVDANGARASIMGLAGQVVISSTLSKGHTHISLNELPAGPYVLSVSDATNTTLFSHVFVHE